MSGAPPPPPPPGWNPPAAPPPAGWVLPPPPYGAPPPRRNRTLPIVLGVLAAVLVLGVAITVPLVLSGDDTSDRDTSGAAGGERGVDTSNLDEVRVYEDLATTHTEGEIDYPQSPPVGGPHNPVWLDCGVYAREVNPENLVHDLEHGTVVLTYRSDLVDADGIEELAEQLPANGILSPWAEQAAPVVITVWGRQLDLVGPDDPRIELFIDEFGAGDTAPEPFASCAGGLAEAEGTIA